MKSNKSQQLIPDSKPLEQPQLRSRLRILECDIESLVDCQYTQRLMDVKGYVLQNYRKFCELQDDLTKLKKDMQPKKNIASEIQEVKASNRVLTMQLKSMKEKNRLLAEPPEGVSQTQIAQIASAEQQIQDLSKRVHLLSARNKAYSDATRQLDMFVQYEEACRECKSWREQNAKLTEQLKECIKEVNARTGKDDNPNIILINIK